MRLGPHLLIPSAIVLFAGCSDAPTSPSPTGGADTAPMFLAVGCGLELDGYRCSATLHSDDGSGVSRDVTGLATWSTSDPAVASVNSVGFMTVFQPGEIAVRATYRDVAGFIIMQVEAGGLRRYYRALSGWVVDAQSDATLHDVSVEILDGPNAGRRASTGSSGAYQFYDLQTGTFTVRFVKSGYQTTERTVYLSGEGFTSLDVRMIR